MVVMVVGINHKKCCGVFYIGRFVCMASLRVEEHDLNIYNRFLNVGVAEKSG